MTKSEAIRAAIERNHGNMDSPSVKHILKVCCRGLDHYGICQVAAEAMRLKAEYDRRILEQVPN